MSICVETYKVCSGRWYREVILKVFVDRNLNNILRSSSVYLIVDFA